MRTIKRYIWISTILLALTIWSCGTRTKRTEKENVKTSQKSTVSKMENVDAKVSAEVQTDLSQYLKESGLKINSTGKPYTLQYNGVIFSGDANLEFSDREEKKVVKTIYNTITTYKSETTHKSITNYKYQLNKKATDLKSARSSWWLYVLIIVLSIGIWELGKYLVRKYNPLSYLRK